MEFGPRDRVVVSPLRLRWDYVDDLEAHLLLYYTGRSRESAAIIEKQIKAARASEPVALQAMHALKRAALEMKACCAGRSQVLEILALPGSEETPAQGCRTPDRGSRPDCDGRWCWV
jgi:D-glycero-alpha-D-manno-heptose-7-phosphate kinase